MLQTLPHAGPRRWVATALAVALLGGCATTAVNDNFSSAQALAKERLGADVRWLTTDAARREAQGEVDRLLQAALPADDAVRIALAYSPALQAMLYEGAAASASATQMGRMPNPIFTFERLVRKEHGERDLDVGRILSVSVLDLLLWPARLRRPGTFLYHPHADEMTQMAMGMMGFWVTHPKGKHPLIDEVDRDFVFQLHRLKSTIVMIFGVEAPGSMS